MSSDNIIPFSEPLSQNEIEIQNALDELVASGELVASTDLDGQTRYRFAKYKKDADRDNRRYRRFLASQKRKKRRNANATHTYS